MFSRRIMAREFRSLMLRNLTMVLLLCIVMMPISITYYNATVASAIDTQQEALHASAYLLNTQLTMLEAILYDLCSTTQISLFSLQSGFVDARDYVVLQNIYKSLCSLRMSSPLVADIIVSFANSGTIVSTYGTFSAIGTFTGGDMFRSYYQSSDSEFIEYVCRPAQLNERLLFLSDMTLTHAGAAGAMDIAFSYYIRLGGGTSKTYAFLLLSREELSKITGRTDGVLTLYDKQGKPLATLPADGRRDAPDENNAICLETATTRVDMKLWVNEQNQNVVLRSALLTIITFTLAALLLSVLMAAASAYSICKPMGRLLSKLSNFGYSGRTEGGGKVFGFFLSSIDSMYDDIQRVTSEKNRLTDSLRHSMIGNYLFSQNPEIPGIIDNPGLADFPWEYMVAYAIVSSEAAEKDQHLLTNMVAGKISEGLEAIYYQLHETSFALIFPVESEHDAQVERLRAIVASMNQTADIWLSVTVSRKRKGVMNLNAAYEEARAMMAERGGAAPGLYMANDGASGARAISPNDGTYLYENIVAGNAAAATDLIDAIFFAVEGGGDLEQRYYYIRMILLQAQTALKADEVNKIPRYSPLIPPAQLHETLLDAMRTLCGDARSSHAGNARMLNEGMLLIQYMQEHLENENLCSREIALALNSRLSERALNDLCKEMTGMSIAACTQKLRLEKACDLLRNTDEKVRDICALCGYGTLNAFYKAFKRVHDQTPSDYRASYR